MSAEIENSDNDAKSLGGQMAESFAAFWNAAWPEGSRSEGNEVLLRQLAGLEPRATISTNAGAQATNHVKEKLGMFDEAD